MSNTTNRYFLGVVKLNLPFRVERVELAPLVFVPAFVITIYILAAIASLFHTPETNIDNISKEEPSGIKVSNLIDNSVSSEVASDILVGDVRPEDMLPDLREYYNKNNDCIGWLKIDGMKIDYPVMQKDDDSFYVNRNFDGVDDNSGSIVMDSRSEFGTGTKAADYKDGTKPYTNLIIGGHNMRNGSMFGDLDNFRKQDFEKKHNIIKFSTLYEEREYEIVAAFLSQIYNADQTDVFKYYNFFNTDSEEEFNDFIKNIKKLQLYDTGVTAEYGDELITLHTCTYHVENGRMVVVGKRIK